MGEVYQAHDTKLGRSVAVKVLPEPVANNPDRIARLQREAQSLAALKHPSIATLYGMEEASNRLFLVMELVEGETLAAHLGRGPLPLAYVLTAAMQIADALSAAHRAGIVHRDLKPDNVMVTKGGVKLVDFGIAKATDPVIAQTETTLPGITEPGAILGTFQYMAPEQVQGQNADARTDLFAFGCVLFEMLTGRKAFEGPTQAAVIAATIHDEPPPISTLQPAAPRALDRVVAKCLAKDRDDRWQSASDLRDVLKWIADPDAIQPEVRARQSNAFRIAGVQFPLAVLAALVVALVATAVAVMSLRRSSAGDPRVTRTVVTLPAGTALSLGSSSAAIAISPDGRQIAYVAAHAGALQLHLRSLDQLDARVIDGVRATRIDMPFFSADSQWLGFTTPEGLWKVSTTGGVPVRISGLPFGRGASWGGDGDIVLTIGGNTLARMSAEGGEPAMLTSPNVEQQEKGHRLAHILPGDRAALFTLAMSNIHLFDDAPVGVLSLETGEYRVVLKGGSNPQYSPSGHLVYARAGTLFAAPFDLNALRVTGPPVAVLHGVATSPNTGHAEFSLARDGSLLYAPGRAWGQDRRVVWVHRDGRVEPLLENRGGWYEPRISPDGRRLAVSGDEANSNIWVFDLVRGDLSRLTNDGDNASPIWAPDGRHVAFGRNPTGSGQGDTFMQIADGSQPAERLTTNGLGGGLGPNSWLPTSFSPDGEVVAIETRRPQTGWDTYLLQSAGGQPAPFMDSQYDEWHAVISPDGRWVAYQSNLAGRPEVYLRPFRGPTRSWRVSTEGGTVPVWNPKGHELFFLNGDKMMAVNVNGSDPTRLGKPMVLFQRRLWNFNPMHRNFDSSPDGQRFAVIDDSDAMPPPTQLILIQHWAEELKRRVPTK